jgi:AraC-like DNA-binding protein
LKILGKNNTSLYLSFPGPAGLENQLNRNLTIREEGIPVEGIWRQHNGLLLICMLDEGMELTLAGHAWLPQKGSVILVNKGISHRLRAILQAGESPDDCLKRALYIRFRDSVPGNDLLDIPELNALGRLSDQSRAAWICPPGSIPPKACGTALWTVGPESRRLLIALDLLAIMITDPSVQIVPMPFAAKLKNRELGRIQAVQEFLHTALQQDLSLADAAAVAGMQPSAFSRYFTRKMGMHFIDYLNDRRVRRACELIAAGKTITEACQSAGFHSLAYFNRVFNKVTGMGPRAFARLEAGSSIRT